MYCIYCGAELDPDSLFCVHCGRRVDEAPADAHSASSSPGQVALCSHCGAELEPDSAFCIRCGQPVGGNVVQATVVDQPAVVEQPEVYPYGPAGDRMRLVRSILSVLHDSDIQATNFAGETTVPFSGVQNSFLRLIKRGILMLLLVLLPASAWADRVFERTYSKGGMSARFVLTLPVDARLSFDETTETVHDDNTAPQVTRLRASGAKMRNGQTVKLECFVTGESSKYRVAYVNISSSNSYNSSAGWNVSKTDNTGKTEGGQKVYSAEWKLRDLMTPEQFADSYGSNDVDFYYSINTVVAFRVDNERGEGRFVEYHFDVDKVVIEKEDSKPVVNNSDGDDEEADEDFEEAETDKTASDKDVVIDSEADDKTSSWRDWLIPVSLISTIGGITIGVAARNQRKRKKTPAGKPQPANNQQENNRRDEDEEESYTYALRISKRLGDTVIIGDEPKGVYAYIVRIDKYGTELTDERLTRMIQIEGDGFLIVSGHTYQQGTMSANVEAPKDFEGPMPDEAVVSFRIASAEGSFTNRMHFKVDAPSIDFAQDELTLPAQMPKPIYLPFRVMLLGEMPSVEISMSDNMYDARLHYDEEGKMFYAIINERPRVNPAAGMQAAGANVAPDGVTLNEVPGTHTTHILTVKAKGEGRSLEVQFPIERFVMGLACENLFNVKCYLENYNPYAGHDAGYRRNVMVDTETSLSGAPHYVTREMAPALTKFNLCLYEYDDETNRIICIPPTITRYEVIIDDPTPVGETGASMLDQAAYLMGGLAPGGLSAALSAAAAKGQKESENYSRKAERVKALGFHLDAMTGLTKTGSGTRSLLCYLSCRGGVLGSPNRWKARICIEAEYEGRKYVVEHPILLLSQPRRQYDNPGAVDAAFKRDEEIQKALESMREDILHHHYADLHMLQMYVDQMLDYYDSDYGFDWPQVRAVFRTFNAYLHNESLINQCPTEDESLCFADGVARTLALGKRMEDSLGFWERLGLGVITLGISEGVFNSLEVMRNMKDYVDKGGDSVLVGWIYGAKVPVREYLMGLAIGKGLDKLKKFMEGRRLFKFGKAPANTPGTGKPTAKNVGKEITKETAIEATEKAAKDAATKSNLGIRTTNMEKVAKTIGERSKSAKSEAKKLVKQTKSVTGYEGENLTGKGKSLIDAERTGLEKGAEKLDRYRRLSELPDTMANRQKRLDALMDIQSDKNAMSLLNDTDNQMLNGLRKQFNGDMKKVHYSAEFDMKTALADQLERDPRFKGRKFNVDDIHGFNATKSTQEAMARGDKITMDYDGTFYVIDKTTNERIYLDQNQVESAFQEFLYKKATGKQGNRQIYAEYMGITDHTIIQNDLHIDSYGQKNIDILLDNSRAWESLPDAARAGKAATDKCMHFYEEGMRLINEGSQQSMEKGVSLIRESLRQCKKQFDNFAAVRDAARELSNGGSKISNEMYAMMQYIGETDIHKGSLKVGECLNGLQQMGTSAPELFRKLGEVFVQIG